jgi:hypothetical protein
MQTLPWKGGDPASGLPSTPAGLVSVRPLESCSVPKSIGVPSPRNSLGAAVRSVKEAQITKLYPARHTLQEATAHGIDIAVLASK